VAKQNFLSDEHRAVLANSAIDPDRALHWGVRSVLTPADLPKGAEELATHVPGILFPIPDPFNNILYQIRADTEPENLGKYRFVSGGGNVLVCWPSMQARIEKKDYNSVVIVEGTKQCMALTELAPSNTLVVGISGCYGWKDQSSDDAIVDGLDEIIANKPVYVLFDADIRTNDMVHRAAEGLSEYLLELAPSPAREVRWISLKDANSKEGIDDYLAKLPPERRLASYNQLKLRALKKVPSMKTAESVRPRVQGIVPNEDSGAFVKVITSRDGTPVGEEVLFNALVRITESMTVVNDLIRQPDGSPKHLGVRVTLEVTSQVLGDDPVYISIPYDELRDFEAWVQRLPRGAAASILIPAPGRPTIDLVNAIKMYRADEREVVSGYARLGWVMHQGQPHYLYSGGAIGPNGNTTSVRGVLEGPASKVRFRDIDEIDAVAAVRATFSPLGFLHKPALWKTLIGANAYVAAGFEPKGMLFFFGEPGSGKTHLAQGATSFFSPDYAPGHEIMASLEGTDNAITSLTVGFHNSFLLFDDAHPVKNPNKRDKQYDIIDSLSRIGYSGGSVGKMRSRWDSRTQSIKQAEVSSDRPFIMITAEFQPYGDDARSQLERMFLIRIKEKDTFFSLDEMQGKQFAGIPETGVKGARALELLGERGVFNDAMATYIRWVAGKISTEATSPVTALDEWREERIKRMSQTIATDFAEDGTRLVENVRTYLIGWIMWLDYAMEINAITPAEAVMYLDSYRTELRELIEEYKRSADTTSYGFRQLLDTILAREAAGELVIARSWRDDERKDASAKPNAITIGCYVRARGNRGDGVAIVPSLLASALHQDVTLLSQVLDRNGVEKSYVFSMNNRKIRGWFIPRELWRGDIDDSDVDDAEDLTDNSTR
jgi:hypothetical protein